MQVEVKVEVVLYSIFDCVWMVEHKVQLMDG
jgi:hypothetical protein